MNPLQISAFRAVKSNSLQALDYLIPHSTAIFKVWHQRMRALKLSPEETTVLANINLESMARKLRRASYQSLCRWGIRLGEEMEQRGIKIDRLTGPLNHLLDICLEDLAAQKIPPQTGLALARLNSLLVNIVVHGYIQQSSKNIQALASNLRDAEQHLHEASAYVTKVYERERRRLSHDLHDDVGPDLMLLKLYLELLVLEGEKPEFQALKPKLEESLALVSHTIQSVRRITLDLGPAVLDELGLLSALKFYARQFSSATRITVTVTGDPIVEHVPLAYEVGLYRVLQGALSNVMKHSKAKTVRVSVTSKDSGLIMVIEDDGVGFDSAAVLAQRSFGLSSMRERAEVLGGSFRIKSVRAGMLSDKHGTRIEVNLPLSPGERK